MRAIITAAGHASRWNNYKGVRKHLVEVQGERLIDRTVRMLRERGISDIVITAPPDSPGYHVCGVTVHEKQPGAAEVDRFLPSSLWQGQTLFVFGDGYYTDEWMDEIVDDASTAETWRFYVRLRRFEWQGWERNRAVHGAVFPESTHQYAKECINALIAMQKRGQIQRSIGLDLYRYMCGEPVSVIQNTRGNQHFRYHPPHALQQPKEDASTDVDWPKDYDALIARLG